MVYTFKRNGVRAVVYTRAAVTQYLDSLTYDMLDQVIPPLSEELPMGMRYFFAKYDSGDLKKSYELIRNIYKNDADPDFNRDVLSEKLSGALIHPETLGEEKYAALLSEYAADRREDMLFELYLCASDADRIPGWITKAHEVLGEGLRILLRCPIGICKAYDGVYGYQAEAGRIEDFTGAALPENTSLVVTFSAATDLNAQVTRLLDDGYTLCVIPEAGMDEETACKMYDALSRVLTRRFRSTGKYPLCMSQDSTSRWKIDEQLVSADPEKMPGAYWQYGALKHLAEYVSSPVVLRCLAECDIVLGAR